jgi:dienelactone hydrolase
MRRARPIPISVRLSGWSRVVVLLPALWLPPAAAAQETASIPGDGVTLSAVVYRPAGSGPFPAVVALHGCGGLNGRDGGPSPRHRDWGARLAAAGFLVVLPDSFGSRGARSQCSTRERVARPGRERVADILATRAWLQSRADVDPARISLLGWSNGGSTVLRAVARTRPADGRPDFRQAVAFYPGCRTMARDAGWRTRLPLLILIGEADNWTPPEPCHVLADRARARGEAVEIVSYPGAVHDFDHPNQPRRERRGLAYTGDGSGRALTGTDPAARADALARVPAFLTR